MHSLIKYILIGLGLLVVLSFVLRVVFDEKIDNFFTYLEARENYEGGKKKFDENFKAMSEWLENYKREHPDATDEEAAEAFRKMIDYVEKVEKNKASEQ